MVNAKLTATLAFLALGAGAALAQTTGAADRRLSNAELVGDVANGRAIAEQVCGTCHEVRPAVESAAGVTPPAFTTIARTPGMTETALTVWLTTFHPQRTMPALDLTRTEREDITAYILWLGEN